MVWYTEAASALGLTSLGFGGREGERGKEGIGEGKCKQIKSKLQGWKKKRGRAV